jgi:hypothetical protein
VNENSNKEIMKALLLEIEVEMSERKRKKGIE